MFLPEYRPFSGMAIRALISSGSKNSTGNTKFPLKVYVSFEGLDLQLGGCQKEYPIRLNSGLILNSSPNRSKVFMDSREKRILISVEN